MRFMITRTSENRHRCPHPSARKEKFIRIDERTVDDPSMLPALVDWYSSGTNHRVEDGHIKRDFEDEGWFIDVSTLEDLLRLVDEMGSPVMVDCDCDWNNPTIWSLEIYDGYRE